MKQITIIWMLGSDSNYYALCPSALYYMVVRLKVCEDSGWTCISAWNPLFTNSTFSKPCKFEMRLPFPWISARSIRSTHSPSPHPFDSHADFWRKRARPHTACSIFHNLTSAFSFISSHLLRWTHSSHWRPCKLLQRTVKKEEAHKRFALHLSALPFTSFSDIKITHPLWPRTPK